MIKIEITKTDIIKKPKFSKLKIWLKNFGIVLPKKGLIKILYEKLSNLTISKENLFWLIKLFSKEYFGQLAQLDGNEGAMKIVKSSNNIKYVQFTKGFIDIDSSCDILTYLKK